LIKIDLGREHHGALDYRFCVAGMAVEGRSRQPLLDACRQIKSLMGPTVHHAGLFRAGRSTPDISCPVQWGAEHTISEPSEARIRLAKYREMPTDALAAAD
jgi:hypothetical protein